jgi:hypothetical protein
MGYPENSTAQRLQQKYARLEGSKMWFCIASFCFIAICRPINVRCNCHDFIAKVNVHLNQKFLMQHNFKSSFRTYPFKKATCLITSICLIFSQSFITLILQLEDYITLHSHKSCWSQCTMCAVVTTYPCRHEVAVIHWLKKNNLSFPLPGILLFTHKLALGTNMTFTGSTI